ncbi:GNAT family N-acetyltransferase [Derxia lacustris]|uniref:GNAT family N-acetyltransferase n=1 Tax=Derxia lacustris TaxID=764842 RepID=UPI001593A6AE|nr:GNAT family N-acetyltransferase [Derxia lacustris]
MKVAVRAATLNDVQICLAFEEKDEFGRKTKLDEIIVSSSIARESIFLAEQDGNAIGYASLNFLYVSKIPLLTWWYVNPESRGQGTGSLLMHSIENWLASLGFDHLLISACRELEIARHRAAGLEEIGALRLGPGEMEFFFKKSIAPANIAMTAAEAC